MNSFLALLKKDLLIELRGKETLTLFLGYGVLFTGILCAGLNGAFLDKTTLLKLFPVVLWTAFLFTATISGARSNEAELENKAFEGILVLGISPSLIYLSKTFVIFCALSVGYLFQLVLAGVLLDTEIWGKFTQLVIAGEAVVIGLSALTALLSIIASGSRLKVALLPLIQLPLVFPLFFAGIEISSEILFRHTFALGSVWLTLVLVIDLMFIMCGFGLIPFLLKD